MTKAALTFDGDQLLWRCGRCKVEVVVRPTGTVGYLIRFVKAHERRCRR